MPPQPRSRLWPRTLRLTALAATLFTQLGCPPAPSVHRTRSIRLADPVVIRPVLIEHLVHSRTRNKHMEVHRYTPTRYSLKLADGREMDLYIDNTPHIVMRQQTDRRGQRLSTRWSDPVVMTRRRLPPTTAPTTQEVAP